MKIQKGFTLVELMVALALGLVVVAAATLLFLTAIKSNQTQNAMTDLQDNANFGLNYITQDIRMSNLNNVSAQLDDQLELGGIVLSQNNYPNILRPQPDPANPTVTPVMNTVLLSSSGLGESNVSEESDQLVIQYQPVEANTYDCEGRIIPNTERMVVQRYFLRADNNPNTGEDNPLALACDAGHYEIGNTTVQNFGDAGEIIMKRVDHFRVLLNVANKVTGNQRYISIADYMATANKPRILGVSLGILSRSAQNVGSSAELAQNNQFNVLDQTVTVNSDGNPNGYIRRVVTQDVALRNALGAREEEQNSE